MQQTPSDFKYSMALKIGLLSAVLVLAASSFSYGQVIINGTVTSASENRALMGVNVIEKGTSNGTSTDTEGNYELEVEGPNSILVFTYIGFITKEVTVGEQQVINVSLEEDVEMLEDVVVVGYGVQDRSTLTSSVSSVSEEDIQNIPTAGADQLMQGQAAGVNISSNSGTPGGGVSISIRGTNSISGGSDPLYVIDGIPIVTGNFGLDTGGGTTSAIADLDPSNIESIEVLKDASATAIYGARASNGVVLITTKRGSNAKPSIEVSSYYGYSQAINEPDLVSGPEYEMLINESDRNNGEPETYANPQSAMDTDWAGMIFRTGIVRNHDITISGGNETVQYAVSGSNFSEDGVTKPATFDRSNIRVNLDVNATENLSFGSSIAYSYSTRNRSRNDDSITGVLGGVYFYPSNLPIRQDDGSYTKFSIFENPIVAAEEVDFDMGVNRLIGNVYGEYEFTPGLTFKTSWSYDYNNIKEDRYDNSLTNQGSAVNGSGLSTVGLNTSWTIENTLSYMFNVDNHNFSTLLGTSIQENEFERTTAEGQQFPSDDFRRISDAAVQTSSSTGTIWGITSFFGRIKYDYDGKYLATVTIRRDGSSRFGENNQWGTFPSLAVGWVASEESFLISTGSAI